MTRAPDEAPARLRIRVLGETTVETAGGAVDRAWLSQRPGQLLRYLVCRHQFVAADQIAEALWPAASAGADENVRYLVHLVRRRLEPQRPPRGRSMSVECLGGAYSLSPGVWVDAHAFEELVGAGLGALHDGEREVALARLGRALELYRGEFLADEPYADWAIMERERLSAIAADALHSAADIYEQRRELGSALDYARRLVEMDRYDSDVQLRVIRLCLRCGRRSEAARRFGAFRSLLLRDFGEEPEFDLASAASADTAGPAASRIAVRSSGRSVAG